jgi:hypothetical protein
MTITTMDGLLAALGSSQDQRLFFPSATNAAGGLINLNQAVTSSFGIMAAPAAASSGGTTFNQSSFSTGFPRWSSSANTPYLGRLGATFSTAGTLHIYDLLWACSGLVGNVATAQTLTGFAGMPTRNSTALGAEIWIGCSSAIGATAHNVTVQYTNQSGTSGRNTVSTAGIASMPANRMYQVPLQSGDTGIQSVQGLTLSASSGTAGNLWIMVLDRIASISAPVTNVANVSDAFALGFPQISDNSCLAFVHQATTTSSGIIMGQLSVVQG